VDSNDQSEPLPEDTGPERQSPKGADPAPTISCSTCGETWDLSFELDELHAGNRALEQFALDHFRHTGHYPDNVAPWTASCQQCPAEERYLERRPAQRFGETHARHARHSVVVESPSKDTHHIDPDSVTTVEPSSDRAE
jgi:hypothetical protein